MSEKISYSIEEAAQQTGCSVGVLWSAIAAGYISTRYAGADVIIRHEDLLAWIDGLPTKEPEIATAPTEASKQGRHRHLTGPSEPSPIVDAAEWLTTADLAAAWQVSPGTLSNWRAQRKGPAFVRFGGLVRYHRDAVDSWLANQVE